MENIVPVKEVKFSHKEHIGLYGTLVLENGEILRWELMEENHDDNWPSHDNNWNKVEVFSVDKDEFKECHDIDDPLYLSAVEQALKDNNYYRDQWDKSFEEFNELNIKTNKKNIISKNEIIFLLKIKLKPMTATMIFDGIRNNHQSSISYSYLIFILNKYDVFVNRIVNGAKLWYVKEYENEINWETLEIGGRTKRNVFSIKHYISEILKNKKKFITKEEIEKEIIKIPNIIYKKSSIGPVLSQFFIKGDYKYWGLPEWKKNNESNE